MTDQAEPDLQARRLAAAEAAAHSGSEDGNCLCSACEILRGEHDDILDAWATR